VETDLASWRRGCNADRQPRHTVFPEARLIDVSKGHAADEQCLACLPDIPAWNLGKEGRGTVATPASPIPTLTKLHRPAQKV